MCLERNVHSFPSEARVLSKPSLKTVGSLFFTGEMDQAADRADQGSDRRFDPTIMRSSRTSNSREQAASKHTPKCVPFAEQHSQAQRKRTEAFVGSFDGPVIDIALVACGLSSTLLFSQNAASRSNCDLKSPLYQSLPLNVKYIVDTTSDLASLVSANGTNVAKYGDLVALVWDFKTNKRSVTPFQVTGMELTMPYLRETATNAHNLGGLLPVEATASGSLFVKTQIEFVGLTKPTFIVVEMAPLHAHSDNSHTTVAKDFFNIRYYTHVTECVSSAFCGDMTDQSRWVVDAGTSSTGT